MKTKILLFLVALLIFSAVLFADDSTRTVRVTGYAYCTSNDKDSKKKAVYNAIEEAKRKAFELGGMLIENFRDIVNENNYSKIGEITDGIITSIKNEEPVYQVKGDDNLLVSVTCDIEINTGKTLSKDHVRKFYESINSPKIYICVREENGFDDSYCGEIEDSVKNKLVKEGIDVLPFVDRHLDDERTAELAEKNGCRIGIILTPKWNEETKKAGFIAQIQNYDDYSLINMFMAEAEGADKDEAVDRLIDVFADKYYVMLAQDLVTYWEESVKHTKLHNKIINFDFKNAKYLYSKFRATDILYESLNVTNYSKENRTLEFDYSTGASYENFEEYVIPAVPFDNNRKFTIKGFDRNGFVFEVK